MPVATIIERPLKLTGESQVTHGELEAQAEYVKQSTVEVDYSKTRGTCPDERPRVGVLSGEPIIEPRPSAFGGPIVYGLYMMELSDSFGGSSLSGIDRLGETKRTLDRNKIPSGGHKECAANIGFGGIIEIIDTERDAIAAEVELKLTEAGEKFEPDVMDEVFADAHKTNKSGRYDGWTGDELVEVLGDEAGNAMEVLEHIPHTGKTLVRTKQKNMTVDQTKVHALSGEYSFVNDDEYCAAIENALANGPDAVHKLKLMRYAREALIKAIMMALPNDEVHEINIS